MTENPEQKNITIAEMAKDISYMAKAISEMKITLEVLSSKMITRDEVASRFDRMNTEIDKRFEGVHTRVDTKLDIEDFTPYKSALNKVNWIILTAVIVSLLTIIGLK